MAIESITGSPINRTLPNANVAKETNGVKPQTNKTGSTDTIAFTNTSLDIKSAIAAGGIGTSDINEERVAAIKTALQSGNYSVNADSIAKKMLQFDNQLPNST